MLNVTKKLTDTRSRLFGLKLKPLTIRSVVKKPIIRFIKINGVEIY